MSEINADIPEFECWLRKEYLYNQESHHGEFIHCVAFGRARVRYEKIVYNEDDADLTVDAKTIYDKICSIWTAIKVFLIFVTGFLSGWFMNHLITEKGWLNFFHG